VQQLRDGNMQTFWQSDGLQPHLITLEFNKQVLTAIAVFCDYRSAFSLL
jgi:anaphase-promoting complex subunit 10